MWEISEVHSLTSVELSGCTQWGVWLLRYICSFSSYVSLLFLVVIAYLSSLLSSVTCPLDARRDGPQRLPRGSGQVLPASNYLSASRRYLSVPARDNPVCQYGKNISFCTLFHHFWNDSIIWFYRTTVGRSIFPWLPTPKSYLWWFCEKLKQSNVTLLQPEDILRRFEKRSLIWFGNGLNHQL